VVREGELMVAQVGDSRLYLVRGDEIRQVTQDHSWVAEQVRLGVLDAEAATGVELTEGYMMDPEASVSALVFHHPAAGYFSLDEAAIRRLERRLRS